MSEELAQELALHCSLFSHDIIRTVVQECKAASSLSDAERVYQRLQQLWWGALTSAGGVATPYSSEQSVPIDVQGVEDPRLATPLAPIAKHCGLGGQPPPFMLPVVHRKPVKPLSITTTFHLRDERPPVAPEATLAPIEPSTKGKRRKLGNKPEASRADVVLGSLVYVDGQPGRISQIYRNRSRRSHGDLMVKVRLRDEERSFAWPSPSITLPFAYKASNALPGNDGADQGDHLLSLTSIQEGGAIRTSRRVPGSMEALFDDILGPEPSLLKPAESHDSDDLEDLLTALSIPPHASTAADAPAQLDTAAQDAGVEVDGRYGAEEVLLVTGERVSLHSLQELEEYFAALKTARKQFILHPPQHPAQFSSSLEEILNEEDDPSIPAPKVDLTLAGKMRKVSGLRDDVNLTSLDLKHVMDSAIMYVRVCVCYVQLVRKGATWLVELEDVYVRGEGGRPDFMLPAVRLQLDASALFDAED